ncbi:alpha/beta fold hydrolase [Seohaeicola zhoushanensis]|uniref:Alpha/beta hydrolase n=1 Tax=Seohaeicola zhoushanensis TaxID=1569283 RepID=A0A8J3H3V8_9RHOB|nr:alpha/beta fold hydrolase [Seohaeicola zhoushanensis]GHF73682.1 alpha/beta hydrolase [Seohaeicola zhoushanensis]
MSLLLILLLLLVAAFAGLYLWSRSLARQARAMVPPAGQVVPVRGGSIHYVEIGNPEAPPLLLIHGIAAQLQHFTYGVTDLLRDDYRLIVIDRPGSGYSDRIEDTDAALPVQARMIAEFLDAKGIGPCVVAGHSLGGAVTLALALDHPEKVRAMALIAPLTHVQEEIPAIFKGLELRNRAMRRFVANTLALPVGKATADKVLAFAFAPESPVPDFMTRAAAVLGLRPEAFIGASSDLVTLETALPAQVARYGALTPPGAVLYGAGDVLLNPALQGEAMRAYGLRYETLPGRGHMLPITAPAEVARFIREVASSAP